MQWKVDGDIVKIYNKYGNWENFIKFGDKLEDGVFRVDGVYLSGLYDFIVHMSYMNRDAVDEMYLEKLIKNSNIDFNGEILRFVSGDRVLTAEFGFYRRGSNFEKVIDILLTPGNGYTWILYLGKNVRNFYAVELPKIEYSNYLRELEKKIEIAKRYDLSCVEELEDEYYSMRNREKNWVLKSIYREASAVWIAKNRRPCCMYIWFNGEVQDIGGIDGGIET